MWSRVVVLLSGLTVLVGACSDVEPLKETVEESIEFESVTLPGEWLDPWMPPLAEGDSVTVSGVLTLPPTDVPLPVVVVTHGCGGIGGAELGWVREFEAAGVATFLVDSFEGRGISNACTGLEGVNQASLLVDVYEAVETLNSHEYVDGSRIVVMGLSQGGRTALWAALKRFQDQYNGQPFAGYVGFYPLGCYIQLENETEVAGGPVRIFHGTADNWLPITQCETYVGRLQAGGVDITLTAYPDAHHAFDDRGLPEQLDLISAISPRNCVVVENDGELTETSTGGPATVDSSCVERGVTIGYNPQARKQAVKDLTEFLNDLFGTN